jgi:hypothetical protein
VTKTTYALLIYETAEPDAEGSARALERHRALQAEAGVRGELHAVARLDGTGTAKTVTVRGDAHDVTDGPYVETKEWLVGFYLVDCASEAEAVERARAICPEGSHAIEVRPTVWHWKR